MELRVCFFGDSFTNGTGDPDHLGWVGRVCAAASARGHAVTSYNAGIRRDTSSDILRRWRREADDRLPASFARALVFSFGLNDCALDDGRVRVSLTESLPNTRAILHDAAAYAPTLFVGPPPPLDPELSARIRDLIPRQAELCAETGVPFLDVFNSLDGTPIWAQEVAAGDGAHPARGGYAALARLVDAWPGWRALLP